MKHKITKHALKRTLLSLVCFGLLLWQPLFCADASEVPSLTAQRVHQQKQAPYQRIAGGVPQSRAVLKDVTLIVSSCDKYSSLWPSFFACLFRYWPSLQTYNKDVPILLIAGKQDFEHPRISVFKTGDDLGWAANLKQALAAVKTPYVLYLQDDYLLCRFVEDAPLARIIDVMNTHQKAVYCQLAADAVWFKEGTPSVQKAAFAPWLLQKNIHARYRTSLQAALWRTDVLQNLVLAREGPWRFEKTGSKRASALEHEKGALFLIVKDKSPLVYLNAVWKGGIGASVLCWMKKEGLPLPPQGTFDVRYDPYVRQCEEPESYTILKASGCCTPKNCKGEERYGKKHSRFFKSVFKKLFAAS